MSFYLDNSKHYILWIKAACPWCIQAQKILSEKSLTYTIFNMDEKAEELEMVKKEHDWETVPLVFEITSCGNFNLIGGCTDLEKHLGYNTNENDSVQINSDEGTHNSRD